MIFSLRFSFDECKSSDDGDILLKVVLFFLAGFLGGFQGRGIKNEVIQRGLFRDLSCLLNGKTLLI